MHLLAVGRDGDKDGERVYKIEALLLFASHAKNVFDATEILN